MYVQLSDTNYVYKMSCDFWSIWSDWQIDRFHMWKCVEKKEWNFFIEAFVFEKIE